MDRHGVAAVVRTTQHQGVKHVVGGDALARLEMHARLFHLQHVRRRDDYVVWLAVLQQKERGHDLGGTGWVPKSLVVFSP